MKITIHKYYKNSAYMFLLLLTAAQTFTLFHLSAHEAQSEYLHKAGQSQEKERVFIEEKKEWTFLVYMAADNDLYPFAQRNLTQMCQIGSSENLNIIVHLDIRLPGQPKVTKRLYVQHNQLLQVGPDYCMNSGDPATLIDALSWAEESFPSDHLALVFWNHGSGDLNPTLRRTINPAELFNYNPETELVELDRSVGFIDFIDQHCTKTQENDDEQKRGICFDETYKSYLDDTKLIEALSYTHQKRNGKNIDLVIFDACLMAGTGTACIMSKFADYMVASEEVVLGPGYNYYEALKPLAKNKNIQPVDLAYHLVDCYKKTYGPITQDYTHSAFILEQFDAVNKNIDTLAQLLTEALVKRKNNSVQSAISKSRSRYHCTYFDEPSYIDIGNFYKNLLKNISRIELRHNHETKKMITQIKQTITEGLEIFNTFIMTNVTGANLSGACGLSIYFPEYKMYGPHHGSYDYTEFARHNSWPEFLHYYLSL